MNYSENRTKGLVLLNSNTTTNIVQLNNDYACPCDESHLYSKLLISQKAKGMYVWFEHDDLPYLDLVMGYSSTNFGHCNSEIKQFALAAIEKLDQLPSFESRDKLLLSEFLSQRISEKVLYQTYFDVGGTAAVSGAIRLCRQFTQRKIIVSFEAAYHGTSLEACSVSDSRFIKKEQYQINTDQDILKLPFPSPGGPTSTKTCLDLLKRYCIKFKNEIAAVIVEPIQGAAGFIFPNSNFLPELREITERYNIMLIVDDIQTGLGRTGLLFSYQHWLQKEPDIVLLSKSIAGGYYPLSAIIAKNGMFDSIPKSGTSYQSTFGNNPLGISIAFNTLKMAEVNNYYQNAIVRGKELLNKLSFIHHYPFVSKLRGLGLAIAWDFQSKEMAKKFVDLALNLRLIIYHCGVDSNVIKIAPPINISGDDVIVIAERIKACFKQF